MNKYINYQKGNRLLCLSSFYACLEGSTVRITHIFERTEGVSYDVNTKYECHVFNNVIAGMHKIIYISEDNLNNFFRYVDNKRGILNSDEVLKVINLNN